MVDYSASPFTFYCFDVYVESASYTITVNDMEYEDGVVPTQLTSSASANLFLKPQGNALHLRVRQPQGVGRRATGRVRVSRVHAPPGEPRSSETVSVLEASTDEAKSEHIAEAHVQFDASGVPELALWTRAQPISQLTPSDQDAIVQLTLRLQWAYATANPAELVSLLEHEITDEAASRYKSFDTISQVHRSQLDELVSMPGFMVEPLTFLGCTFEPRAYGRLWQIRSSRSNCPIRGRFDGNRFSVPMMAAKIHGTWRIMR